MPDQPVLTHGLRAAADDAALLGFLDTVTDVPLPMLDEHFPPRLYGG